MGLYRSPRLYLCDADADEGGEFVELLPPSRSPRVVGEVCPLPSSRLSISLPDIPGWYIAPGPDVPCPGDKVNGGEIVRF